jgi:antitoxin component YwqK of YwqJK toxin-antitoxin module
MLETYRDGLIHMQQWDQDQDEQFEKVAFFERGDIIRVEEDSDLDGIRETAMAYRNGKPFVQSVDANQDGKEELRIFYDADGQTERIEKDVSMDGIMDATLRYKNNQLVIMEKDTNADGEIDMKIWYDAGRKKRTLRDLDYDGRFETTHWYNRPPWTRVTELDTDGSGKVHVRSYFMHDILRRRETLKKSGDRVELCENFNEQGFLVNSQEDRDADGRWDMTWYFDDRGRFLRAEKDSDADDRVDIWYHYEDQRLSSVSEDTNGDGRPDVWEDYDTSEILTQRKKDLDFDGVADIEERF